MKKLIIAAAIVCAAAVSQAAMFRWSSSTTSTKGTLYDGGANKLSTTYSNLTAYLFDTGTMTQQEAFNALVAGTIDFGDAVASSAISSSKLTATTFDMADANEGDKFDFFFVVKYDDKNFYVSSLMENKEVPTSGSTPLAYADLDATSKNVKLDASKGFKGAGVYTAAVPEPTSGLLLLLGMAGMALRRRRA